jgi:hypothetical protein
MLPLWLWAWPMWSAMPVIFMALALWPIPLMGKPDGK